MISLDDINDELRARVDPAEADLILRFSSLFFANAAPEFFRDRGAGALAGVALAAFRHLQRSSPDDVEVEMMDPPADEQPTTGPVTVIRTHVSERPFIVTTIREYLYGRDIEVEGFLHPVLRVKRDAAGAITEVGPASEGAPLESIVHCEVHRIESERVVEEVRLGICRHLEDAVAVTNDFAPMTAALDEAIDALDGVS